jgi:hypothetical protein
MFHMLRWSGKGSGLIDEVVVWADVHDLLV